MKQVNTLISERLKKPAPTNKMSLMAERSVSGQMTSFAGLFSVSELSDPEKASLLELLSEYAEGEKDLSHDLNLLSNLTSEVKAINNQAALLHGERIKKVQNLLKGYREGAFSAWLIAVYGNRQTPYNLLQYYEFYEALPKELRPKLETMPRQAVYTLASREGDFTQKLSFVKNFQGETKQALLNLIRELFPLDERDKRKENLFEKTLSSLERALFNLRKTKKLSSDQKEELLEGLKRLKGVVDRIKTR
jgi:hypothetical protein